MGEPVLTEQESKRLSVAAQILIGYYLGARLRPHFILYTEDTGWDTMLAVCGCRLPEYTVAYYDA